MELALGYGYGAKKRMKDLTTSGYGCDLTLMNSIVYPYEGLTRDIYI